MSASQEKKVRKTLREEGKDKRQIEQKKAENALKRKHRIETGVTTAIVVIIAIIILFSSSFLYSNFTAVKVGDVSYSAAEYSFFYKTTYTNFVSQYGDYISYIGLDTSKPLNSQTYEEGKTWADYFKESAQSTMKEITAMYSEAQKAGFVLSEEDQAQLDSSIESLKTSNEGSDYSSANAYLSATYGKGCTVSVISGLLEKYYVANAYSTQMNDSFTYTSDDLKSYYAEHKDNLDKYTYISYLVDGSVPTESTDTAEASASPDATATPSTSPDTEAAAAAAMAAAKDKADKIASDTTSADTFKQAVLAQTQAEASQATTAGASLTADYADWLKDASRVEGDKTVIETDTGYYVLYFISRDDNSYKTINVRHILIKAVASEDGTYSDEAKATAKAKADALLAEWKAGDATEDSFATLANANTEDTGSNTNGGLYEKVYKGQMVTEFNDWCFAEGRKTGDTAIVFNEGSYCGYHVIYYVGESDTTYADTLAETEARTADYTAWKDGILANFEVKSGLTASLVK
ncbi:MAG: peptidylprolyl isomerase [Oscillospiraceae bacterium]|nr:peptidylprolyl isomerase [Oscillospiraceae bacterium]